MGSYRLASATFNLYIIASLVLFEYTSRTVSYAEELISYLYVTQRGMALILPCPDYYICAHKLMWSVVGVCACSNYTWVRLRSWCSVVRWCTTSDDVNKDYMCTLPTSPRINRPPHLKPSRARPELQRLINTLRRNSIPSSS